MNQRGLYEDGVFTFVKHEARFSRGYRLKVHLQLVSQNNDQQKLLEIQSVCHTNKMKHDLNILFIVKQRLAVALFKPFLLNHIFSHLAYLQIYMDLASVKNIQIVIRLLWKLEYTRCLKLCQYQLFITCQHVSADYHLASRGNQMNLENVSMGKLVL